MTSPGISSRTTGFGCIPTAVASSAATSRSNTGPTSMWHHDRPVSAAARTGAAAVRASYPTTDGTLDWLVVTTNYGGYFASWDDVGVSGWVDVPAAFLVGTGSLSATVMARRSVAAAFAAEGTLSATVTKVADRTAAFTGDGTLSATAT